MKLDIVTDSAEVLSFRRTYTIPYAAQTALRVIAVGALIRAVLLGVADLDRFIEIAGTLFAAFVCFSATWLPHGQVGSALFHAAENRYELRFKGQPDRAGRMSDLGSILLVRRPINRRQTDWLVRVWRNEGGKKKGRPPRRRRRGRDLSKERIEIDCGNIFEHAEDIARRLCRLTGQEAPVRVEERMTTAQHLARYFLSR